MKNFNETLALVFAAVAGGACVVTTYALFAHNHVMLAVSMAFAAMSTLVLILNGLSSYEH